MLMAHLAAIFRSLGELGLPVRELVERANRCSARAPRRPTTPPWCAARRGPTARSSCATPATCRRSTSDRTAGRAGAGRRPAARPVLLGRTPRGHLRLAPGDSLVLCTDGLTESRDPPTRSTASSACGRPLARRTPACAAGADRRLPRRPGRLPRRGATRCRRRPDPDGRAAAARPERSRRRKQADTSCKEPESHRLPKLCRARAPNADPSSIWSENAGQVHRGRHFRFPAGGKPPRYEDF